MRAFEIRIKSREKANREFIEAWRAVQDGKGIRPSKAVYFTSLDAVRRLITDRRLALLHLIRQKQPQSIYELARLAGRNFKNVHSDVKLLERYGLIEVDSPSREHKTARRSIRSPYQEITIHAAI